MTLPPLRMTINLNEFSSAEELDQLSHSLQDELDQLDSIAVRHDAASAPPDSKGPAGVDVGTLVVTLSNSAVLIALAEVLKSWINRSKGRDITIQFGSEMDTIKITSASRQDIEVLLQSWSGKYEHE